MNYRVPTTWKELTEYQLLELSPILIEPQPDPQEAAIQIIQILFTPLSTPKNHKNTQHLLLNVGYSSLMPYAQFLSSTPQVFHFPQIEGLQKPSKRLGSLSIRQFSITDQLFYNWFSTKKQIYLRQMVASLYTLGDFSQSKLPQVADITDRCPHKLWLRVALAYISCRHHIINSFPIIFPQKKEPNPENPMPQFSKNQKSYTPFNDVIIAMSFDNPQPLGNYQIAKNTNLYEFLNILTKSIIRQEKQNQ